LGEHTANPLEMKTWKESGGEIVEPPEKINTDRDEKGREQ